MQVILRKQVETLGSVGDVKEVTDGYFRNFLFPRRLAEHATPTGLKEAERIRARALQKQVKDKEEFLAFTQKLQKEQLVIHRKATEEGRLFGSVTERDIKEFLDEKGYTLEEKMIHLEAPIKELGTYTIAMRFDETTANSISLAVEREA